MHSSVRTVLIAIFCLLLPFHLFAEPSLRSLDPARFYVKVTLAEQKVYVYCDQKVIRTMTCSSGIAGSETPKGRYKINESGTKRGEWFYSKTYKEGAKYWVGFIGGEYLFHSVPFNQKKELLTEEAKKLGQPASHGCIRMSLEDALWFYKNIPNKTQLDIE